MSNSKKILLENIYFQIYLINNHLYLSNSSKEDQEKYDNLDIEKKLELFDEFLEYFKNFWILIKNESIMYTLNVNLDLVMINLPIHYYKKIGDILNSLRDIFETNLIETNIKIYNVLVKNIVELILVFYKPVKKINII
tara:strand:+ start:7285 stop:7698 length:414 start_codon:yes stop_codon:yes gene_type:complete